MLKTTKGKKKMIKTFEEFLNEKQIDERVETSSYEAAHGKKPKGYGSWLFSKHKQHDFGKHPESDLFQHSGNYGEAKKHAEDHFNSKGHKGAIHVQS